MKLLIEIQYPSGSEYYTNSSSTITYNSIQYKAGIMLAVSGVSRNMGLDGRYETGIINATFIDIDLHFRNKTDSINSPVIVSESDGTKLAEYTITETGIDSNEKYFITGTDRNSNITDGSLATIGTIEFPAAGSDVTGQQIPLFYGPNPNGTYGTLKAWKVDVDGDKIYLLSRESAAALPILIASNYLAVYHGTTDVTGSITNFDDSYTLDGVLYFRRFMKYAAGTEDYLTFSVNDTGYSGRQIEDYLRHSSRQWGLSFSLSALKDLFGYCHRKGYVINEDSGSSPPNSSPLLHYQYSANSTGSNFLNDMYLSTLMQYRFNKNGQVDPFFMEYDNLSIAKTVLESAFIMFKYTESNRDIQNKTRFVWAYDSLQEKFTQFSDFQVPDVLANQSRFGIQSGKEIELRWILTKSNAFTSAKHQYIRNANPTITVDFDGKIDEFGADLLPGDIVTATHRRAKKQTPINYQLIRVQYDYESDTISGQMVSLDWINSLDLTCKLLIHSFDATTNFFNSSPTSESDIIAGVNVTNIIDAGAVDGYSIDFDGSSYLMISDPAGVVTSAKIQGAKWDIHSFTNYSISCFVTMDSVASNQDVYGTEPDANHRITLLYNTVVSGFRFVIITGGTVRTDIYTTSTITTGTQYHVYVTKIGNEYAIYLDGNQEGYQVDTDTASVIGDLFIGSRSPSANFMNGRINELRFGSDNILDAVPVVGLTDTITVPANGFDWYGIRT